jgi:predicted transcriptional regulator
MKTIEVTEQTKKKLEQIATRRNRSESEVLEELVASMPVGKRRSPRGVLEGKADNLLADADFEGFHQDMLKRYGPDAE